MTDNDSSKDDENKLKLYTLLIEQFLRHQTTIWQIPAALVFGNFVVIGTFPTNPIALSALGVFNSALIFVFYRMIKGQQSIIEAIEKAQDKLKTLSDFLPIFQKHRFKARDFFMVVLVTLEICLFLYIGFLFLYQCHHHCHSY